MAEISEKELAGLLEGLKTVISNQNEIKQDWKDHLKEHQSLQKDTINNTNDLKSLQFDMYNAEGVVPQERASREKLESRQNKMLLTIMILALSALGTLAFEIIKYSPK